MARGIFENRTGNGYEFMKNSKAVIQLFKSIHKQFSDALFPPSIYCIVCEKPIDKNTLYSLCNDCLNVLNWANNKTCIKCGRALEDWYPAEICGECVNKNHEFDDGISCLQYSDNERMIIHDFKYHKKSYLARIFAEILYDRINMSHLDYDWDLLVPVPMFAEKENTRGYNQAALLAYFLSEKLEKPFEKDLLIRLRDTVPMNHLGAEERRHNLDGAFCVNEDLKESVKNKRILLVDDIYTTGITANECSRVLKSSGAAHVTIITLAAGLNQRELPNLNKFKTAV